MKTKTAVKIEHIYLEKDILSLFLLDKLLNSSHMQHIPVIQDSQPSCTKWDV